jgi:membrane-bound inhibitor of C-type lysozyme
MKIPSLVLLTLLTLPLPATAQQRLYRYQCEGGKTFEASYSANQAMLTLPGRQAVRLPEVRAASGARYSDGTIGRTHTFLHNLREGVGS